MKRAPRFVTRALVVLALGATGCGPVGSDASDHEPTATSQAALTTPFSPSSLPDIRYHLTARPWVALNTPKDSYLDRIEPVVRYEATLQNGNGAIVDPVVNQEWQYATPYFANALGVLMSAGRAQDLLQKGINALNNSTSQMATGNSAIPQQHGNFFIAPMADSMTLYAPFVAASQITTWKNRMMLPIASLTQNFTHNWVSYAMKGQWYRFQQGLVSSQDAFGYIEDRWINTQRSRFTGNVWNLYHDTSSDPETFAYDAAARANLWEMLVHGYNGASAAEMTTFIKRGTQSGLLLQDATGQAPEGGRSGLHSWNDVYSGLGFEMMAERAHADGNDRLAGQYRRQAMLALRSVERWHSAVGYYNVTKNHFDPALRVRYADYSQLTNYNGNVIYHMAESWRARQSSIAEQPAPVEIGGYAWEPDSNFAVAMANAGGMQLEASMRGTTALEFGQYWTTLGITRFSRVNWDSRLGPSDGVRDKSSALGVSYAPTFLEAGNWTRMASVPSRYQGTLTITFTHPLLVRARIDYAPVSGQTGPTFRDDLIITPDGVLSTITSSAAAGNFGVTWPVLTNDGAALTNTFTPFIASVSFPGGGDQQNFIAIQTSAPTMVTNSATLRSSYGDLRPVRVVPGGTTAKTLIYPRSPWDPSAEGVRTSFTQSGSDFSTILGKVTGSLYVGRTSAGGVGAGIDLNGDGTNDVTFGASCGFILQLANGRVTAVETDANVSAVVQGTSINLLAFTPAQIVTPQVTSFEAEAGTLAGGAVAQTCAGCSRGQRVGLLGNQGTNIGTVSFNNVSVPSAGSYVLTLYYLNQDVAQRLGILTVNGVAGAPVAFASTANLETPAPIDVTVNLNAGNNTIAFGNGTAKAPSLDRVVLTSFASVTPDFALTAGPSSQTVTAGATASYTVTVAALNGFGDTVNLTIAGLPAGATPTFTPASIAGGLGTSNLSVSTSSSTPPGSYLLTIRGTDAVNSSLQHSAQVTLIVASTCITATPSNGWQNTPFANQTGTFTAQYDATPSASPTDSVVAFSNGAQTAYAGFATLVRFNPSGNIDARNGGAFAAASVIPYAAGQTYHFRVVVNVASHTYSSFVTPPAGTELTIGSNFAFRSEQATVPSLNNRGIDVNTTATGTTTVCNFGIQ
jgi:hypothetical protein